MSLDKQWFHRVASDITDELYAETEPTRDQVTAALTAALIAGAAEASTQAASDVSTAAATYHALLGTYSPEDQEASA